MCVCVCACVFVCFLSTCSWCVQYVQMRLLMFFFTRRFRFGLFAFDGKSIKVFSALIAKELGGLSKCPLKLGNLLRSYQPVGMPRTLKINIKIVLGDFFWVVGCHCLNASFCLICGLYLRFVKKQFRRKCISRVALGKNSKKRLP